MAFVLVDHKLCQQSYPLLSGRGLFHTRGSIFANYLSKTFFSYNICLNSPKGIPLIELIYKRTAFPFGEETTELRSSDLNIFYLKKPCPFIQTVV